MAIIKTLLKYLKLKKIDLKFEKIFERSMFEAFFYFNP